MAQRVHVQLHIASPSSAAAGADETPADLRQYVMLPHPRTGNDARYMLNGTNLFEVMLAKPPEELGSWFYGNMVKQDGFLHMVTPVDPVFVVVPLLQKHANKRFIPINDIWDSDETGNYRRLAKCNLDAVKMVCDFKEVGGGCYFRYSEDRLVTWLIAKVERLVKSGKHECEAAVGIVQQYVTPAVGERLKEMYGVEKMAAKRKADTDAKVAEIERNVAPAKAEPVAPKPRLGFGGAAPNKDMFHAKIITKKEEEKLVPLKKTKLDKIDRSGMKSLSSFFGRKSV